MKRLLFPAIILALLASPAFAELYQWRDEGGGLHVTDSMDKVPEKYKGSVSVFQEGTKETAPPGEGAPVEEAAPEAVDTGSEPSEAPMPAEELYGDETLDWWAQSFEEKRAAINDLQNSVDTKAKFIEVFEAGRRFGQVFERESVEKYKAFKQELPADRKRLSGLKDDYSDFQRKAAGAGVPRNIREQ